MEKRYRNDFSKEQSEDLKKHKASVFIERKKL